jgi:hypothetical protein
MALPEVDARTPKQRKGAGSCGPGNLHLINGLFDAHRTRVLAIAAHIPSAEIGGGYFQETHPQILFRECSHYCELVSDPSQLPYILANAMRAAIGISMTYAGPRSPCWQRRAARHRGSPRSLATHSRP